DAPRSAAPDVRYPLVPWPARLEPAAGEFLITPATRIAVPGADEEITAIAELLADAIRTTTGVAVPVSAGADPGGAIELRLDPAADGAGAEAYRLVVTPERITISAAAPVGLFYGVQTLRQLLPVAATADVASAVASTTGASTAGAATTDAASLPAVAIGDEPRFKYRGMHLDVSRHLFPVSFIKRYIDLLAMYRINTFHWHLTDDQGWR